MKILDDNQINQVSGGMEGILLALCVTSIGISLYNSYQIRTLNNGMSTSNSLLDFVYSWTIFHDAQLSLLPNYDTVSSMTFGEAYNMISK